MEKGLSLKQKNIIAKKSYNSLLKFKQVASISYVYIGKELKNIKENKLYRYLGEGSEEFESFEQFIASSDVNIELRKAYYLIQIYTTFVEEYNYKPEELADTHWTALRALLPVVKKENVKELVEKARLLTRGHLEQEVKCLKAGIKTLADLNEHECEWEEIRYWRCRICGEKSKFKPSDGKIVSSFGK